MDKHSAKHPTKTAIEAIMTDIFAVDDMSELHLLHKLKAATNLIRYLDAERHQDVQLSSTRMRLLTHLVVDQRLGNDQGLQPSEISRHLGLSRNTVSALLNGLEEQGLVERHVHPRDRRQFLIRITQAGENIVETRAPEFALFVSTLFEGLSLEERATLIKLLDKLVCHLVQKAVELGLQPAIYNTMHENDIETTGDKYRQVRIKVWKDSLDHKDA